MSRPAPQVTITQTIGGHLVGGPTFMHRELLKEKGGVWQSDSKSWWFPSGTSISFVDEINSIELQRKTQKELQRTQNSQKNKKTLKKGRPTKKKRQSVLEELVSSPLLFKNCTVQKQESNQIYYCVEGEKDFFESQLKVIKERHKNFEVELVCENNGHHKAVLVCK